MVCWLGVSLIYALETRWLTSLVTIHRDSASSDSFATKSRQSHNKRGWDAFAPPHSVLPQFGTPAPRPWTHRRVCPSVQEGLQTTDALLNRWQNGKFISALKIKLHFKGCERIDPLPLREEYRERLRGGGGGREGREWGEWGGREEKDIMENLQYENKNEVGMRKKRKNRRRKTVFLHLRDIILVLRVAPSASSCIVLFCSHFRIHISFT